MKSILISIRPKWVAKILKREKTLEIRKTAPKCDLPINVYIYCTKGDYIGHISNKYVGKVVAKFTLKKCELIMVEGPWYDCYYHTKTFTEDELLRNSCLMGLEGYLHGGNGYAWHISDLEILDEPKELRDFKVDFQSFVYGRKPRPPFSWQYVEAKE